MMSCKKELFASIVGDQNVVDRIADASEYTANNMFIEGETPELYVRINSGEELESVIQAAGRERVPVVLVSSDGPHNKGGVVPQAKGAAIVDMRSMNRILSINGQQRMAVIEAGVTYEQLQPELAKHGLQMPFMLAPKHGKSVLASLLDVEPRLNSMHQWNYMDPLRCIEVTWGDGYRMMTGAAAGGDGLEKQWEKQNWQIDGGGPMMIDYYRLVTGAQGSMGAVSWASVRCERLPNLHKMYMAASNDMNALIGFVYKVLHLRYSDELFLLNRDSFFSIMGGSDHEIPEWIALVGIAGREICGEERVSAQTLDLLDIAKADGLELSAQIGTYSGEEVLAKVTAPCEEGRYWKNNGRESFADLFFMTTLNQAPEFVACMKAMTRKYGFGEDALMAYVQPVHQGVSCMCEFVVPYERDKRDNAAALFTEASAAFAKTGAYYSRPYGQLAEIQIGGDEMTSRTIWNLKGIFDPYGIMNPGKLVK